MERVLAPNLIVAANHGNKSMFGSSAAQLQTVLAVSARCSAPKRQVYFANPSTKLVDYHQMLPHEMGTNDQTN